MRIIGAALLAIGIAACLVAVWLFADLAGRAEGRVKSGQAIDAQVLSVKHRGFGIYGGQEIRVEYRVDNTRYETGLMSVWASRRQDIGSSLRIYVDPADPARASTKDSFVSEGMLTTVPSNVFAGGFFVLVIGIQLTFLSRRSTTRDISGRGIDGSTVVVEVDFRKAWRGYDPVRVGRAVAIAVSALDSPNVEHKREAARVLRHIALAKRSRGFATADVDRYIQQAVLELEASVGRGTR